MQEVHGCGTLLEGVLGACIRLRVLIPHTGARALAGDREVSRQPRVEAHGHCHAAWQLRHPHGSSPRSPPVVHCLPRELLSFRRWRLFGATNLGPPVIALAWIFLGWQFALALPVGAVFLVAIMALIVRLTCPKQLLERARSDAAKAGEERSGMHADPAEGLPGRLRDKLASREAWRRVATTYRGEWSMVWKDLFFGFLFAGAVATLVPDWLFQAIFPRELPTLLLVLIHALLGPVLAVMTIIGSMGNGPLAAVLWENGVLFAGIMAFLYSDFVVVPSLRINASYYGWPFAAYLAAVFTGSAVGAALLVYGLFSLIGLIPEPRAGEVQQLAQFEIDYAFFLGVGALLMTGGLLWLARRKPERHRAPA